MNIKLRANVTVVRKRSFALDHEESQGYPSSTSTQHDVRNPEMEGTNTQKEKVK